MFKFKIFSPTGICHHESSDYKVIDRSEAEYLEGAEPFEHVEGNRKAVLFIHGYPGSAKMYYLVRKLAIRDGYDVFSPTIPGFGTNHGDMIKSNFSMWYKYLSDYYTDIRVNYKEFYIVGNSMGGALTLKLAEEFNKGHLEPTAIATIAPPVFVKKLSARFVRFISFFKSYIPAKQPPKDKSLDQDGETEWVGYYGLFPKQVYSLLLGFKSIKKDLYLINTPCYFCHAKEDKTVSFDNLGYITDHISSENILVRILRMKGWKHSNHSLFIYRSYYENIWNDIELFFKRL